MQKDFDEWNERKKFINDELDTLPYQERDIWWCSIGINIGFEEDGDGERSERPVLIIHGFSRHICWAIPLTTSMKENPYHFQLGIVNGEPSSAIISQMRPIDTQRLLNKIGIAEKGPFLQLKKTIKDLL